jgi:AAA15 family ATPase/GTPase
LTVKFKLSAKNASLILNFCGRCFALDSLHFSLSFSLTFHTTEKAQRRFDEKLFVLTHEERKMERAENKKDKKERKKALTVLVLGTFYHIGRCGMI